MSDKKPETKTLKQWETQAGVITPGDPALNQKLTKEEFRVLYNDPNTVGVDHDFRTQWLKENGYEVTRENMINVGLRIRSAEER